MMWVMFINVFEFSALLILFSRFVVRFVLKSMKMVILLVVEDSMIELVSVSAMSTVMVVVSSSVGISVVFGY